MDHLATIIEMAKRLQGDGVADLHGFVEMALLHATQEPARFAAEHGISSAAMAVVERQPAGQEIAAARLLAILHAFASTELDEDSGTDLMMLAGLLTSRYSEFVFARSQG
ncbi:MAG TPA: hypothetical protein VG963_32645 [Polyangiaceae bacterium]|nr:hypothetical protein [Polyangiaceae bacterium]